jgi:aminomethyltransferase
VTGLRATPFHVRSAALNRDNAWRNRAGFSLAASYGDISGEALAARMRVALADISWRWRVMLEGARAGEFLSRLLTRDTASLAPGTALKALWLGDAGGVRGAGAVARFGRDSFQLISAARDAEWLAQAAALFSIVPRDVSEGGLAIVGPYARATLTAAGLDADLEPLAFRKRFWRGLDVTLSRWGEHGGYELWCKPDDGIVVWDRLMRAGAAFGIQPAGLAAMDLLDIEAGVARPERDYAPARDAFAESPTPRALGLEKLIDENHKSFNGRAAWLAAREKETMTLAGIEIDGDVPAPFSPLIRDGRAVGHAMTSAYSPSLRRAIALARIELASAAPGTALLVMLAPTLEIPEIRTVPARVAALPFLPAPDQIAP